MVAQGEYAVGISWDQAIYGRIEKGFPIEAIVPDEGTAFDLESVAIFKTCKNLEGAKKLVDWLGSKEGPHGDSRLLRGKCASHGDSRLLRGKCAPTNNIIRERLWVEEGNRA